MTDGYKKPLKGDMTAVPKKRLTNVSEFESTERLVELAQENCADSFRQLVQSHQQMLRMFLARHINCKSHVDDIAQEVFLVAFRQIKTFRRESKFSTWLLGIARNKALQFLREDLRRRTRSEEFFQAEIARRKLIRLGEGEDSDELQQQRMETLKSCLSQLPLKSRVLIDQFYFDQQSSSKIAAESNQKSSAIRMKLMRIRGNLMKCIKKNTSAIGDEF